MGNLWTLDYGSGKGYSAGYNFSGFGSWVYAEGSTGNPFKFGGGNGCQTDADIGLVLMGHRYYDTRIGRFISQDPAGDGDNWYAYAGNDPMNGADPTGLEPQIDMQPDWGNTSDPGWMNEPAGVDSGSTYDCPGMGWMSVGNDGFWHQGVSASVANYTTENVSGPADANNLGFGGFVDNNVTFGAIGRAGNTAGLYDAGKASRGAVIGTIALAGVAIVGAALSDGEDAAAGDTARFTEAWAKGTFESVEKSWAYHFNKHGEEVGAESLLHYLRKAEGFNQNLRGSSKSILDNAIRYSKNGKFIIKDFEGKILSFGNIR